jgi:hypothetical protein
VWAAQQRLDVISLRPVTIRCGQLGNSWAVLLQSKRTGKHQKHIVAAGYGREWCAELMWGVNKPHNSHNRYCSGPAAF